MSDTPEKPPVRSFSTNDPATRFFTYDLIEIGAMSEREFNRYSEVWTLRIRNEALCYSIDAEREAKAKRDAEATAKRVATRAAHKAQRHPKQAPEQAQEAEA